MECLIFSTLRKPTGISNQQIQKLVAHVLRTEKKSGDIAIHLIGDAKMTRLNMAHRGKKKTTDVLSFAAQEGNWKSHDIKELGDIFLSLPKIKRQAKSWGVPFQEEFNRMLIHGLLHILGYDHIKKSEAEIMFAKQEKYLNVLVKIK